MPIFTKFQRLDKEKSIKTHLSLWVIYIYICPMFGRGPYPLPQYPGCFTRPSRSRHFPPIHPVFLFYCGCAAASAAAPRPDIYLTSLKTFCVLLCYEHVLRDQEQSIPRNVYLILLCLLNPAELYHIYQNWGGVKEKGKRK